MKKDDRLEKIEKQLELLMLKVDIIYNKISNIESYVRDKKDPQYEDELYNVAKKIVKKNGVASAGFFQRKLNIGYARAARLLDNLEGEGIVIRKGWQFIVKK